MNILHISNWYPNPYNKREALWIKRSIDSLHTQGIKSKVYHLEVIMSNDFKIINRRLETGGRQVIIAIPTRSFFVVEILSTILLLIFLLMIRPKKHFDLVNFHIAYPLLIYGKLIKSICKLPLVVSEHWSAYHYRFNLIEGQSLDRMKRIFNHEIPVITVSKSLGEDIVNFASKDSCNRYYIVPNVVDTSVFFYSERRRNQQSKTFLMASKWQSPKDPVLLIQVFISLLKMYPERKLQLRIAGYGRQWEEIANVALGVPEIVLLGPLDENQLAQEMRSADAFLHASNYETFSVVCAEALVCGTPVVASGMGGVREYLVESAGILVEKNDRISWLNSLDYFMRHTYDSKNIHLKYSQIFSPISVGAKYKQTLQSILDDVSK